MKTLNPQNALCITLQHSALGKINKSIKRWKITSVKLPLNTADIPKHFDSPPAISWQFNQYAASVTNLSVNMIVTEISINTMAVTTYAILGKFFAGTPHDLKIPQQELQHLCVYLQVKQQSYDFVIAISVRIDVRLI